MAKTAISPEQFVAEVNKRLPNHHAYQRGWRVFLYPEGTGTVATGYGIEPRDAAGHIVQVVDHVRSLFAVVPDIGRNPHD
ncbi:hypothetical protein [Burkholderia gladioli]|uniref:hypothetical protein n=1 Tax=Burkholderia gladioli TaxID=28095 RepID=UPI0016408DB5|nr:hypothetical protein [Burkholderia gladioli]